MTRQIDPNQYLPHFRLAHEFGEWTPECIIIIITTIYRAPQSGEVWFSA